MSINFPTFEDKEIVTPEKLNDFVQALEAKFTAGLGTAEIQWPLLAGGDIIMGQYSIQGTLVFWNIHNGAVYDSFSAALSAGAGSCIFVPPETTIDIGDEDISGSRVAIIGAGPSSKLRASGTASDYMLTNQTSGAGNGLLLANLTMSGNSVAGVEGIRLRGASNVVISNVHFEDFEDAPISMFGSAGIPCANVIIHGCTFEDSGDSHIQGIDCKNITIDGNVFDTSTGVAIDLDADSGGEMRAITISDNSISGYGTKGIRVVGGSGSYSMDWSNIAITGNVLDGSGSSSIGIEAGTTAEVLQYISILGNVVSNAGTNGINVLARYGVVNSNVVLGASSDGIDLTDSVDLVVNGNQVRDAGSNGIDYDGATDCTISNNDCEDAGTPLLGVGTGCVAYGNRGGVGTAAPPSGIYTTAQTYTIPANTLKVGDVLDVQIMYNPSNATGTSDIHFDGVSIGGIGSHTTGGADELLHTRGVVISTTQISWQFHGVWGSGNTPDVSAGTTGGLTFTQNNDVELSLGTITIDTFYGMHIQYSSAEIQ